MKNLGNKAKDDCEGRYPLISEGTLFLSGMIFSLLPVTGILLLIALKLIAGSHLVILLYGLIIVEMLLTLILLVFDTKDRIATRLIRTYFVASLLGWKNKKKIKIGE